MLIKRAKRECNALKTNIEDILNTGGISQSEKSYLLKKLDRINATIKELDRIEKTTTEVER